MLPAGVLLTQKTGFALGTELIYSERVRVIDGEVLIVDSSYFDAHVVVGLTQAIAKKSINDYLEHELGVQVATSRRSIRGERARSRDVELLDMGDVDWVVVLSSNTFDSQGNLIEFTESRHRIDCFHFIDTATRQAI